MTKIIGCSLNYPKHLEDFGDFAERIELWISVDDFLAENVLYNNLVQNPPSSPDFETYICLFAAATGCDVEKLLPRGEIVSNPRRFSAITSSSSKPRAQLFHVKKLRKFLTLLKPSSLTQDERSNLIFAVFRVLSQIEKPEEEFEIVHFLRNLIDEQENFELVAEVFSQLSDDIPKLHRLIFMLLPNLKIALRLILETLIGVTQRSEFSAEIPDFQLKTRPYCQKVLKLIDEIAEGEKWAWRDKLDIFLKEVHKQFD